MENEKKEEIKKPRIKYNEVNVKEKKNSKKHSIFGLCILVAFALGIIITLLCTNIVKNVTTNEKVVRTTVKEESDLKEAISKVYNSSVYIEVTAETESFMGKSMQEASGSGFVYKKDDKNAYILTNYHVIDGAKKIVVTYMNGTETEATVVGSDEYSDIAVLKVDAKTVLSVAEIGSSAEVELGDTLFTVGAPLGKEYMGSVTKGILSGKNRMVGVELSSGSYLMEALQIDAAINSGNSGGALCNIKGQVIGVTSSKLVGEGVEGMGFAIPMDTVNSIINDLEQGKKIERPYVGVQVVDIDNSFQLQYYYNVKINSDVDFGAIIAYVEDGKPADKAGLKVGDIIIEMDGAKVKDSSHFRYNLYKHKINDKIKIKYYRDNKIEETTITLSEAIK